MTLDVHLMVVLVIRVLGGHSPSVDLYTSASSLLVQGLCV